MGKSKYKWCRIGSIKNLLAHQRFISLIPNFCGTRRFCENHAQSRHHFSFYRCDMEAHHFPPVLAYRNFLLKHTLFYFFPFHRKHSSHQPDIWNRACYGNALRLIRVNGTRVTRAWWKPSSLIIQCCRIFSQFWCCAWIQICCCAWSYSVAALSAVRVFKSDQSTVV
jgi:uncharacterized membrane protein YbaN (DUF454 family)